MIFAKLNNCISKCYGNNNSDIIRNAMVRYFGPDVSTLLNMFSIISQVLDKTFCRHSTNILCLLQLPVLHSSMTVRLGLHDLFTVKMRGSVHALDTNFRMSLTSPTQSNKSIASTSVLPLPSRCSSLHVRYLQSILYIISPLHTHAPWSLFP